MVHFPNSTKRMNGFIYRTDMYEQGGYMFDVCEWELTIIRKHGTQNKVIMMHWINII